MQNEDITKAYSEKSTQDNEATKAYCEGPNSEANMTVSNVNSSQIQQAETKLAGVLSEIKLFD